MQAKKWMLTCGLAVLTLVACTATVPVAPSGETAAVAGQQAGLKAEYAALAQTGGRVFALNPGLSSIRIHVFRGGRAARLGHNHVVSAPRFDGFFFLPESGATNGRFDLAFRLDELEFDRPEYRAALGPAFSSTLSTEAIAATRAHMLGADNLQADQFPFVSVRSLQIVGEAPLFATRVQIGMHGQQREQWLPLHVEGLPESLAVTGSLVLRQSDFGMQPYSALGGLLAVQDEVVIEFTLRGN